MLFEKHVMMKQISEKNESNVSNKRFAIEAAGIILVMFTQS